MKRSIFLKILLAFLFVSIIPVVVSNFLIVASYQTSVEKHIAEMERGQMSPELEIIELGITRQNLIIQSWLTIFLILILVIFVSVYLSRNITLPLREIARKAKKISAGDLNVKVEIETKDEFGVVAETFNKMVEDLKEAKTILEIKVQARTKELQELAERQEELVKQRTEELQEKLRDLERFEKLAVGRELKMIELKEKVKELEKGRNI